MRKKTLLQTGLALLAMVAFTSLLSAQDKSQLKVFPLSDFENSEDWRAFATSPLGITKIKKTVQKGPIYDIYNKEAMTEEEKKTFTEEKNHVLGVKTFFNNKGFDRVEFQPPHELVVKGIVRQVSLWALGRNFGHTMYVKLRDYRGTIHKLRLDKLNYLGWRKLTVTLPGWLPQSTRYSLLDKNLHVVSIFVESDKFEPMGTYYFYVDQLQANVDKTDMTYPGSRIKDIW